MASLTLRSVKGAPLTNNEVDGNFTALNTELGDKIGLADLSSTGDITYNSSSGVISFNNSSGYITSYTETDPIVGAINGLVKADGAGNISAATAGTDYLATETDPVVGAITGIVKADGAGNISAATAGTDYAGLSTAQSFTGEQTFAEIKETVFTLATSGTVALDPANGSIQTCASAGPTFTDSLEAGQSLVLHVTGGDSSPVTFPTVTWVTSGGNVAPTATASDVFVFWKISTTLYGAYVGSFV